MEDMRPREADESEIHNYALPSSPVSPEMTIRFLRDSEMTSTGRNLHNKVISLQLTLIWRVSETVIGNNYYKDPLNVNSVEQLALFVSGKTFWKEGRVKNAKKKKKNK
jgi:hypothetical protein